MIPTLGRGVRKKRILCQPEVTRVQKKVGVAMPGMRHRGREGDAHLGRPMRRRVRGGCRGRPGSGHLVGGGHHHHVALILGSAHVHGLHGAVEVDGGPVTVGPRWHQHRWVAGSARRQLKL